MINWEQLKNFGLSREELQERGLLDQMLRGYKTNQVVPIKMCIRDRGMSNSKNKRYEQKQLYTDGTVQRDNRPIRTETDGGGNQPPENIR